MVWLGAPLGPELFGEVLLLSMILLLAMIQLVALGYLISTTIKSSSAALGAALAIFFVLFMIVPSIVQFLAVKDYIGTPGDSVDWDAIQEKTKEYTTKYLFYVPTSQVNIIVQGASARSGGLINPDVEYLGLWRSMKENVPNVAALVGMTALYMVLVFYRFLRMDLR
nr:ABC transporter permease subunit [Thermococcus sp. M36]